MIHDGGHASRQARKAVVARDGARCWRCRGAIDLRLSGLHPKGLTVGHIIPVSKGGSDAMANLAPEHRRCNRAASDRLEPPAAVIATPL